jgi:hypothetical protein
MPQKYNIGNRYFHTSDLLGRHLHPVTAILQSPIRIDEILNPQRTPLIQCVSRLRKEVNDNTTTERTKKCRPEGYS